MKEKNTKSDFMKEFDKYLETQYRQTTFNGLDLKCFPWYRKVFGLDEKMGTQPVKERGKQ